MKALRMPRKLIAVPLAIAALSLSACDGGASVESWKGSLGPRIQHNADKVCKKHHGTANIMLATDRYDDGIVTCQDGTNHIFDL
jgi:hypothetical protein